MQGPQGGPGGTTAVGPGAPVAGGVGRSPVYCWPMFAVTIVEGSLVWKEHPDPAPGSG